MTFSIVGCDRSARMVGVAIASVFPAVGAVCPYVTEGAAISTQAWDSGRSYGEPITTMIDHNISLPSACRTALDNRPGAEGTQLHGVALDGKTFAYTGERADTWAGHREHHDHTVAGNLLAGKAVVERMSAAFDDAEGPLPERLLTALEAGEAAGGDKRGDNLSAALLVRGTDSSLRHNLRVDDPGNPIEGLWNAYDAAIEAETYDEAELRESWGGPYPDSVTDFLIKY